MTTMDPLKSGSYHYHLPPELIAKEPARPKDAARLLVYDRKSGTISHHRVRDLPDILPECAILFNDTKVIKARIFGRKTSGGKVELLLNRPLPHNRFNVLIKGRVREGTELLFDAGLSAVVERLEKDGSRVVRFFKNGKELGFGELIELLEAIGHVPLPPYIERPDTAADERDYQPLLATHPGAVAAPTASLHFTPELLDRLRKRHPIHTLTLHVGAGTFKPVESETITDHPMHTEYYRIPKECCDLLRSDAKILAVGTTVTRAVEHYVRTHACEGECDLFLHPHNPPRRVDYLMTNFHLPRSTLMMLVAAFVGLEETHRIYAEAVRERYRFYSYGDAMLIL
jgi:S-adenosylmethionine:tRNA ribosyltransferase-isomerase